MRVGLGYDAHRFAADRPLVLGGVTIAFHMGLLGHSDADVLVHAMGDAMLGAAGLGDLGKHFPDTDTTFKGISSLTILKRIQEMVSGQGYRCSNIDAVIVAQKPKLAGYIDEMKKNIAACLDLTPGAVNIKATTTEGMGFEGRQEGISAQAVVLLVEA